MTYNDQREQDEKEMVSRTADLAVAEFIMSIAKCPASELPKDLLLQNKEGSKEIMACAMGKGMIYITCSSRIRKGARRF
jgi:hypothetical protein